MDLGDEVDGQAPLCAGCRLRIVDKFYLCAVERKWHSACLKCAECGSELENEASCFEKEGNIYKDIILISPPPFVSILHVPGGGGSRSRSAQ